MQQFKFPLLFSILILLANLSTAQIAGKLTKKPDAPWTLKNIEGVNIPVVTDEDGNFNIPISKIKKGIYSFGEVGEIYLEPEYKITVKQVDNGYTFSGKGSLENNLLWMSKAPIRSLEHNSAYGVPYWALLTEPSAFLPILDDYEKKATLLLNKSANPFFKEVTTGDVRFTKKIKLTAYVLFYGMDSTKLEPLRKMLRTPLAERKPDHSKQQYQAYLAQFSKKFSDQERSDLNSMLFEKWDMGDEVLFKNSDNYRDLINRRINFTVNKAEYKGLKDSLKSEYKLKIAVAENEISNQYIRDYQRYFYTFALIKSSKNVTEIEDSYQQFMAVIKNPGYRKEIETVYSNLKGTQEKAKAPEFSFMDNKGASITLKSLRGKYVYIDIWATWCAPCIAEIPDLKKLEELYRDKKIQFVSLSVDTQSNKKLWLNYVQKNDLKGIQLIADKDFSSDFIKKFGVTSIPRFLLIGPDGLILDNDAKRPSNVSLRKHLDELLL